jgi:hypothetical protein
MRAYPATLSPDRDGGFTLTFRDVPEAITEGDTREEALLRAETPLNLRSLCTLLPRSRCPRRPKRKQVRKWCRFRRWGWRKPHCTMRCANKASAVQNSLVGFMAADIFATPAGEGTRSGCAPAVNRSACQDAEGRRDSPENFEGCRHQMSRCPPSHLPVGGLVS